MTFLLHLLSLFAVTPTEKAELAVGKIVLKWAQWGINYFASLEGKQDIGAIVELAKDFGATSHNTDVITLPATPSHPETTYIGGQPAPAHQSPADFNADPRNH